MEKFFPILSPLSGSRKVRQTLFLSVFYMLSGSRERRVEMLYNSGSFSFL